MSDSSDRTVPPIGGASHQLKVDEVKRGNQGKEKKRIDNDSFNFFSPIRILEFIVVVHVSWGQQWGCVNLKKC